ncbi:alpha/beta fold hydrolase [Actinospica acidiphila]|uniref:alpha/beta fold hydrolase n=1 Tax=Actinospica acidiphila TaxID=304899 RepID=UPI0035562CF2
MSILRRNNVRVTGATTGRPVVLVHGFGCDQNMWRLVEPLLAEDHPLVLFDYVGAGRSDLSAWQEDRYSSLDGYARDLVEVLEELDLRDAVVVGHSVSSMTGVLAAAAAPSASAPWSWCAPRPATSTRTVTAAASPPRTSRNCSSPWSRTTSAGRRPWPRSSWETRTVRSSARS